MFTHLTVDEIRDIADLADPANPAVSRLDRYRNLRDRIAALSEDAFVELAGLFMLGRRDVDLPRREPMAKLTQHGRFYARYPEARAMLAGKRHCLREYLHDGLVALGIEPGFVV